MREHIWGKDWRTVHTTVSQGKYDVAKPEHAGILRELHTAQPSLDYRNIEYLSHFISLLTLLMSVNEHQLLRMTKPCVLLIPDGKLTP